MAEVVEWEDIDMDDFTEEEMYADDSDDSED